MAFLPKEFIVPTLVETALCRLRPLTIHDVVKDYDAVMSSREHLWAQFGAVWRWPQEDLTLEQDLIDLGWHQKEFQTRSSFDYAVMSLDEARVLGCVYIDPTDRAGYEAEVCWWVRQSERETGLEDHLAETVREWISKSWPFDRVGYPGSEIGWDDWYALPQKD